MYFLRSAKASILFLIAALCFSSVASAVTVRTVTVMASGGNYTSLAAAITGESKNLVALDRQLTILCYASAAPDTKLVSLSSANGWVTDSTHYIRIVVPTTERHSGVFNSTKYYRIMNDYEEGIVVSGVPYTRIEGLQFYSSETSYTPSYPIELDNSPNCLVDSALIDVWNAYATPRQGIHMTLSGGSTVRNTIIYGAAESAIGVYWDPVIIDNVTLVNASRYNNALYGIDWSVNGGSGHLIRNVYCGGFQSACFNGPASSVTMVTSASSDQTGSIKNVSIANAAFVNPTNEPLSLRIQATSALKGAGTNLSAYFGNDIKGQTRTVPWDIGADQTPSGPPPSPNEKWLRALYQDVLGRAPTPTEIQQALGQLSGGTPRSTIVQNLCSTAEGSGRVMSLVQSLVLNSLYQSYLARTPTTLEVSSGDYALHSPLIQVMISILVTDEYYQRAQTRF